MGGGTGPATGTLAATGTPGPDNLRQILQPVHLRPMFASFGKALGATLISFGSQASLAMAQPTAVAKLAFMLVGAGLSQRVWDKLDAHGEAATGERVRITPAWV